MLNFTRYSVFWVLGLIALIAVFYLVRAFLGYRRVAADAAEDYDYKLARDMIDPRLSRDGYISAYKRYHAPRNHAYIGFGVLAILILTPIGLAALNFVSMQFWDMAGRPPIYAPRGIVWQFIIFFGTLCIWGLTTYMTARRYYKYAPKTLRDEILREIN